MEFIFKEPEDTHPVESEETTVSTAQICGANEAALEPDLRRKAAGRLDALFASTPRLLANPCCLQKVDEEFCTCPL